MGVMGFLRNRAGIIIVVVIGFSILAFLVNDGIRMGTPFWRDSQNNVGEVAGTSISYTDFAAKVDQNAEQMKQQFGGSLNEQMMDYVRNNAWNQEVSGILLDKEMTRLGISVSAHELNDMLTGKNPDPQVIQNFGDPKTGQVDRDRLNNFIANVGSQPQALRDQWENFLVGLRQSRLSQKYFNLVKNSIYVTSIEAREEYSQRNKLANFNYVMLDYASLPDNKVTVTDDDYRDFYEENKGRFKNDEETRTIDYVIFNAAPTAADSLDAKKAIEKTAEDFRNTTNDSLFVAINSDNKIPVHYVKKGELDPKLDTLAFAAAPGTLIGPVFTGGAYKLVKVLAAKTSPDSVRASHILLNATAEGGMDKAKTKADSIASLIRKGASFAELAKKYGTDGTKDKGGDLGMFTRDMMFPEFSEPVFDGKTGDVKVITSRAGVHVVRIDAQKGSSRIVKVAEVDKGFTSSSKTQQDAYAKALAFLAAVGDDEKKFDSEAGKNGRSKQTADVTGSGAMPGIDNARELIKWAYKADEGDIADKPFTSGDMDIVAKLRTIHKKGIQPLDAIKEQIKPQVITYAKGRILEEKMNQALSGASTINAVAQKTGKSVMPAQNIVFANPIVPGIGQENKVIGTVFGMQPNKLSKSIRGDFGVYVVSVNGFTNPAPLTNTYNQKQQMMQALGQQSQSGAYRVLVDKGNVKDYRVRFF